MKLTDAQLPPLLAPLPDWQMSRSRAAPFLAQFVFTTLPGPWVSCAVAVVAELAHHPEWSNVYNRVAVTDDP
jgi:4a-hydroxytetrahydrobiopterin dehydratase